jgi:hypothetical protein
LPGRNDRPRIAARTQKLSIDQATPDRVTSPKSEKKSAPNNGRISRLLFAAAVSAIPTTG